LLVDDHPFIRKGIIALIEDEPDMEVLAEAANGREAIERYRTHRPDVTLMDLQMSELDGVDAIIAIRSELCRSSPDSCRPSRVASRSRS
jgi:YesN/AraC family two-component response regulator